MTGGPVDAFISYSDADHGWVEGVLLPAMTAAGIRCHHQSLFALGKPRLLEFEAAVRTSDRTVLVLSPAYLSDETLQFVDMLAQHYGQATGTWPVIPILYRPVTVPLRLRSLVSLDATDQALWPSVLERLCRDLNGRRLSEPTRPLCPYPGMQPFTRDSPFPFFGRSAEIDDVVLALRSHPFLALIGASGSGKSSLAFAGVLPALQRTDLFGQGSWLISSFRPGETADPQVSLFDRLETHLGGGLGDTEQARRTVESLLEVTRKGPLADAARLLLIIDQFEEVYTLQQSAGATKDAKVFQEAILRLSDVPDCFVLLTVRADFFGELMESPTWRQAQAHRYELTTIRPEGMRQAIIRPAESRDVFVDDALVERLLADAGTEPGILPFLQETLVLLWQKLRWRYLPLVDYEAMVAGRGDKFRSGLEVAMARRADAAIHTLPEPAHEQVARRILLRLVQFGEGRSHTRRQQSVAQLASASHDRPVLDTTLQHLAKHENRLLSLGGHAPAREDKLDDHLTVDLAHDKLITGWPTLHDWIVERRDAEEKRRRFESKADEWHSLGRQKFGGGVLDAAELREADIWLSSSDAEDVGHSDTLRDLVRVSRRWVRLQRGLVAAIPAFAVLMLLILWRNASVTSDFNKKIAKDKQTLLQKETERANASEAARKAAEKLATVEAETARVSTKAARDLAQQLATANASRLVAEESNLTNPDDSAKGLLLAESVALSLEQDLPPNSIAHQRLRDWILRQGGFQVPDSPADLSRNGVPIPNSFGNYFLSRNESKVVTLHDSSVLASDPADPGRVLGEYEKVLGFSRGCEWLVLSSNKKSVDIFKLGGRNVPPLLVKTLSVPGPIVRAFYSAIGARHRFVLFTKDVDARLKGTVLGGVCSVIVCDIGKSYIKSFKIQNAAIPDGYRTTPDDRFVLAVKDDAMGLVDFLSPTPAVTKLELSGREPSTFEFSTLDYMERAGRVKLSISLPVGRRELLIADIPGAEPVRSVKLPVFNWRIVSPEHCAIFPNGYLLVDRDSIVATQDLEKFYVTNNVKIYSNKEHNWLVTSQLVDGNELEFRVWDEKGFREGRQIQSALECSSVLLKIRAPGGGSELPFFADSRLFAVALDNRVVVCDIPSRAKQEYELGVEHAIRRILISDDRRWLIARTDRWLYRWSPGPSSQPAEFLGPSTDGDLYFQDDGRWLMQGRRPWGVQSSRLWDMSEPQSPWPNGNRNLATASFGYGQSDDGKHFVTSSNEHLILHSSSSDAPDIRLREIPYKVGYSNSEFTVSPDGRSCLSYGPFALVSAITGKVVKIPLEASLKRAWFSADSKWLVTVCEDFRGDGRKEAARIWSVESPLENNWALPDMMDSRNARSSYTEEWPIAFSRDGKWLVAGAGNLIHVYDLRAGRTSASPKAVRMSKPESVVTACEFVDDGKLAVAAFEGQLDQVMNRKGNLYLLGSNFEQIGTCDGLDQVIGDLVVDGSGRWIAAIPSGGGSGMYLVERRQEGAMTRHRLGYGSFTAVCFSQDSLWFAGGMHEGFVQLVDLHKSIQNPTTFTQEASEVRSIGFSPDGRWLFTTDGGRRRGQEYISAKLWDMRTRDPAIGPVRIGVGRASWWDPTGSWIYSFAGGILTVHPVSPLRLVDEARAAAGRAFTKEELRFHQVTWKKGRE
jgi:WD40 repeat protein